MRNLFWVRLMNWLILFFIGLLIISLFTLPLLVNQYVHWAGVRFNNTLRLTVFLYATAIPFLLLLLAAWRLCKNVLQQNPFCLSSIQALNVMSICAFLDSLLYAVSTIVLLSNLLSLTLMVAAFMIGLVSLITAQLFKMTMEIKQENDLTI